MTKDKIIWIIIKLLSLSKIIFYRIFYGVKFPLGSMITGYPKIRFWNQMKFWSHFSVWRLCRLQWNIKIWDNFFMNEFWTISAWWNDNSKITIWNNVMIWPLFFMISWDHWFKSGSQFNESNEWKHSDIKIWNNVWIWARVTILKWVTIWDNVVIWAWSVVTKDIPSNSLAVWNPCRFKKSI